MGKSQDITPPEIARLNPNAKPGQFWYSMLNTRRERGMEDYKIEGMSEEEIAELGDESYVSPHINTVFACLSWGDILRPRYKYTI